MAAAHNASAAAVALRWVTQQASAACQPPEAASVGSGLKPCVARVQGIVAVTSSDKASHIQGDLDSFDLDLTSEDMERLARVQ